MCSKYIGRLVNVGIAKETVRGTGVAPTYWVPKSVVSFFDRATKYRSRLNYGNIAGDGGQSPNILEWAEGSIEGDLQEIPFGLLLLACFGADTPIGPTNATYSHAFSIANTNTHTSLSITLADPDRTDRYTLAMLDSLEIDVKPDDVIQYKANFKARTGKLQAAASPSYSTYNKFLGRHANIKIATLVAGLTEAAALQVKSLKLKIGKNTIVDQNLGTVWPDDILNSNLEIEGEIELYLNDQTYRQYMLNATYMALRISIVNPDANIGTPTAVNPSFTLDLARVQFEGWEPARGNSDVVSQKVTFRALYDTATSTVVNACTLVNTVVSY